MSDEIDTTEEVWKTIPEFPDYSVSNLGRIRRDAANYHPSFAGLIIKQSANKVGYLSCGLSVNRQRRTAHVSRIVAQAFIEPDPNPARNEVNHKNGIKADNRSVNLEWVTHQENIQHSYIELGRRTAKGEASGRTHLTNVDVAIIRQMMAEGVKCKEVASQFGINKKTVWHIYSRRTWSHVP